MQNALRAARREPDWVFGFRNAFRFSIGSLAQCGIVGRTSPSKQNRALIFVYQLRHTRYPLVPCANSNKYGFHI
jgi:hypothetical protein